MAYMLLGSQMLLLGGKAQTADEAKDKLLQALRSGAGKEKLRAMIQALGGDGKYADGCAELCNTRKT